MSTMLVFARVLLSAVFVAAGGAKLLDPQATRHAATELGLPRPVTTAIPVMLPLTELAVAVLLLPVASATSGAWAAFTLLVLFTAIIGVNLLRGRKPPCRCFGSADTAPIGWRTLVRNGVLLALAAFVAWEGPGPSIVSLIAQAVEVEAVRLSVAIGLIVVVAIQAWFILNLIRQQGRLLRRLDRLDASGGSVPALVRSPKESRDLPIGDTAPAFELVSLRGETVLLGELCADGNTVLLFFLGPRCKPCVAMAPDVERWQEEKQDTLRIAVIGKGWDESQRTREVVSGIRDVLIDDESRVADSYGVSATPAAVLIDAAGTVASRLATGARDVERLVASTDEPR